jgi:hypothetical protein
MLAAAAVPGCGQMQYQDTTVTARTFHPDPGLEDVYVGADAEFAVTNPKEARPAESPEASNDVLDTQTSQRAWEQTWGQATTQPGRPAETAETPAGETETDYVPVNPVPEETNGNTDGSETEPTLKPDFDTDPDHGSDE